MKDFSGPIFVVLVALFWQRQFSGHTGFTAKWLPIFLVYAASASVFCVGAIRLVRWLW